MKAFRVNTKLMLKEMFENPHINVLAYNFYYYKLNYYEKLMILLSDNINIFEVNNYK
jgi:hypothetical protein